MTEILTATLEGFWPRSWVLETDLNGEDSAAVRCIFDRADDRDANMLVTRLESHDQGSWRLRVLDELIVATLRRFDEAAAAALEGGAAGEIALTRSLGPLRWTWRLKTSRTRLTTSAKEK